LKKATITTPFNTATPETAMNPTPALIEKGIPRVRRARIPPVTANGIAVKTSTA
jgi:hypothetical protein